MNQHLSDSVTEFINPRSMIGCIFDITEYTKQVTNLSCKMYVDADYDPLVLKSYAETYLRDVVFKYGNLDFGDTLVKTDVEKEIKSTFDGVISFRINTPTEDIITPSAPQNILTLGTVTIQTEVL